MMNEDAISQENSVQCFTGTDKSKEEHIQQLIRKMITVAPELESEDFSFLENATQIWVYHYHTKCSDEKVRLKNIMEDVIHHSPDHLLAGNRYIMLFEADPHHQLLTFELPFMSRIVCHVQGEGSAIVDFGTTEGLGDEVRLTVVRVCSETWH